MKNSKQLVEDYLLKSDWRVNENSNAPYSFGAMNKYLTGEVSKDYWLNTVYNEDIRNAYLDGYMHIHDLGGLSLYCCGYSLKDILMKGVRGIPNVPTSSPANHFDSALNQIANLITILQNEILGAVALNSFDTLLAPFIKKDGLTYKEVKQSMQNFVFSINSNSRAGAEPAFSNITFDLTPPRDLLHEYCIVGGEFVSFTYERCQQEIDMLNRAFFEIMLQGDSEGKLFAYPIPTYNIHERFDWENPNNKLLWEMAGKYGTPYFANFLNSDLDISDVRSMCPLAPNTEILVRSNHGIVKHSISTIYNNAEQGAQYEVWTPDGWCKALPNRQEGTDVYKLTLSNGEKVLLGENHLQPIKDRGTIIAKDIAVGDWVPFNKTAIGAKPISNYELGYDEDKSICNKDSGYNYYSVVDIEILNKPYEYLYCMEVNNTNHLFMLANGMITHNCRLRLDLSELRKKNGGLFGAGDSTGSIGVVTINLPRIGYEAKGDKKAFYDKLRKYLILAKDSLQIKRQWLQKNVIETNLIPAYMEYVGTLKNHFSTIGVIGMNEMCENFLHESIKTPAGKQFALQVGEYIRNVLIEFQAETGCLWNYEATPAESTCYRLAAKDKKQYSDIITQGSRDNVYYTNSCHIAVNSIESIQDTFVHQEELQSQFTGGTVIHIYMNTGISGEQAKSIIKTVCSNYKVPYVSLSPISRYCPEHGYIKDTVDICPICGQPLKKYQRITGYLRCIDNFNKGKRAEFEDRKQL